MSGQQRQTGGIPIRMACFVSQMLVGCGVLRCAADRNVLVCYCAVHDAADDSDDEDLCQLCGSLATHSFAHSRDGVGRNAHECCCGTRNGNEPGPGLTQIVPTGAYKLSVDRGLYVGSLLNITQERHDPRKTTPMHDIWVTSPCVTDSIC